jgi:8-oxoguanine deaminase
MGPATSILIRGASHVWTGDAGVARLQDVSLRIQDGCIAEIGALAPRPAEQVIDARDAVVAPGWVNTHHHFFQSLLKAVPAGISGGLAQWSPAVSMRFRHVFDEPMLRCAVQIALSELVRSGCTTVADHHFLNYPSIGFDSAAVLFEEAERFGIRLVLCRGGSTFSAAPTAHPALAPESADDFLLDVERLAARHHDPGACAFRRIAVAPTLVSSRVRREDLREMAAFARQRGLRLHSHLNETEADNEWCQEHYGCSAVQLCVETGWAGPDVWFAHMLRMTDGEIAGLGAQRVGLAHCPRSNARLQGGIARVRQLRRLGVPISIGVDGAGSNESADMLAEMNFCWYLHNASHLQGRPGQEDDAVSVQDVIGWASSGGAQVLGLDVGRLAPGAAADLGIYRFDDISHAGLHDLASGLVLAAQRPTLTHLFCGGRLIARDGLPLHVDLQSVVQEARRAVGRLRAAVGD